MTRKYISGLLLSLPILVASAQEQSKEYPKAGKMEPNMTEFWLPQPKIVTPGTAKMAPSDAIVLFDGTNLSEWESTRKGNPIGWEIKEGALVVKGGTGAIRTKQKFESFQLHLEWSAPTEIVGTGQGRANSGVFLQERYEVQILDNYENETYSNGQAGSIYKQTRPLVNAMRKPGEWNVYDIIYTAPIFKEDGTCIYPPRVTVIHNGVVVQNNTTILGPTEYIGIPKQTAHGAGSIMLQDHGNPVRFRNIWIREL